MDTDNKKLFKYLGIIFISVLICYKLPHSSYSIIEYIIRPIRINYTTIYLAGLIPLVLFIIGIKGLFKLKRNEKKSKFFYFYCNCICNNTNNEVVIRLCKVKLSLYY